MKTTFSEAVIIPDGVTCTVDKHTIHCAKGGHTLSRTFFIPDTVIEAKGNTLTIVCKKANKKVIANLRSIVAHLHNMFKGLDKKFVYEMEICNVHFPMTVKLEGNKFVISNFLGEKEKRVALILPHVNVEVKGVKVTVSSNDVEAAGQTAANIERATHIPKRDRRVFQDGIFITAKGGMD